MAKTLTLRLTDADQVDLVEWVKRATWESTASKAIFEGLRRLRDQEEREADLVQARVKRKDRYEVRRSEVREAGYRLMRLSDLMAQEVQDWDREDGSAA